MSADLYIGNITIRDMPLEQLTDVMSEMDDRENRYWEDNWEYASQLIDNGNRQLALMLVTQDRHALFYAPEHVTKDKDIVIVAVGHFGRALQYADESSPRRSRSSGDCCA